MKNLLAFLAIFLTIALFGYVIEVEKITGGQAPSILPFTHLEQKIEQKNIEQIAVVEKTSIKPEINSFQVPILVYHNVFQYFPGESEEKKKYDVEPLVFEQQMQFLLKNGYHSISFNDLAEHFLNGQTIPEKSFVINFDDGRESQYENAFPILKKYNLTATFFIYTN